MSALRVVVDTDLCQGHGVCENEAPGVFTVPKGGPATVAGTVDDSRRAELEAAVRYCPTSALSIEEATEQ